LAPAVEGMKVDASLFRPATYIETALRNMSSRLLISGALIAAVLLVLLGNWRSSVVGILAILSALVTAGLVLYVLGVQVNMLIMTGLLVGVVAIIDDAVVDVHNVARRLRQHRGRGSMESVSWVIREAMVEMRSVLLYSTVIVLLALVPVFFLKGIFGAFLQPAAYAYSLAVIASLLVGLTVTPAISLLLFNRERPGADEPRIAGFVRRAYERLVAPHLNRPTVAFAVLAVLVVAAVAVVPNVRQEALFPTFKETEVVISLDAKPGTSHPAMSTQVADMGRKLRAISGVKTVAAHIGRAIASDEVADVNSAELWATIDTAADYTSTLAAIRKVVDSSAPDLLDCDVHTYLADRIQHEVEGEERGLVVRVYGEDLAKVEDLAKDIVSKLKTTDGVSNAKVEAPTKQPRIEIEPDLDKCMAHGIKPGEVRRKAAILLSGIEVGQLFDEQKVFEVVVWGKPEIRKDFDSVKNLLIETEEAPVRLEDLAQVRIGTGPTVINHEAVSRYIDVTADVSGRDLGAIGRDVEKLLRQINFPLEYRAEMLGAPAERLANQQRVLAYAIAALVGIYLLLQVACNSWRVAILVMLMLPLSMVGGLVASYASGGTISYGSVLGFIALLAIAVRSSLLLIRRYQQLGINRKGEQLDPEIDEFRTQFDQGSPLNDVGGFDRISPELVLAGTRDRFIPMLVSTVAILLACAPFVVTDAIAGLEILRPMAKVVLGGLVTTALVNLYVLPALYLWLKAKPLPDIVTEPIAVTEEAKQPATAN
jgi:Cu/Ag efflux pump CusA